MAKKKKKQKKNVGQFILLTIMIFFSAGLITAMFTLNRQRTNQNAEAENPDVPESIPEETEIQETTEPKDEYQLVAELTLQEMTMEEKIYQLFIVTPEVLVDNVVNCVVQSGQMTKKALEQKPVGGIIYFSQNLEAPNQTKEMLSMAQSYIRDSHPVGLWLAVDEEGGTVARVADNLGTTQYSDMSVYGERGDVSEVFMVGSGIAEDISQFGFNLDFAPVADVYIDEGNELQNRIFSRDPAVVSEMVASMVEGLQNSGAVSATLKHFPGLGAENGNTHEDAFAYIERTYEELENTEFLPFKAGINAGADFVMVGHQIMSCAGDELPSDLSPVVITDWLRGNLGYNGIVVTDAHNMNTISENYSSGESAVLAIQAGADIVLMPENLNEAFQAVYDAVEQQEISEERINESVLRILTAKAKHHLL